VFNRFETDFKWVLEGLEIQENSDINVEKADEFLHHMGFINEKASTFEPVLAAEIFKYIS
jgi:hypothetical protein